MGNMVRIRNTTKAPVLKKLCMGVTASAFTTTSIAATTGTQTFLIDIPCLLTKSGFPFSAVGDFRVEVKFCSDTALSPTNVTLTNS